MTLDRRPLAAGFTLYPYRIPLLTSPGGVVVRRNISSGAPWEPIVGYSRAVRVGNSIHVSGTAAIDDQGAVAHPGDAAAQARRALDIMLRALAEAGASARDVVRTRIFVTDISQWEAIGRAHGEVFGNVRPATSMVEVARLIHPDMLVEIEADAVLASEPES
jgi:enamine deaminase RidA (YjgF/YER057c/UK114 family)